MKNLVIFLYFVFLFKLAFAQSLPSMPGLGNGTLAQGTDIATDQQERILLAQSDVLPENLDLPELGDDLGGPVLSDAQEEGIKIGGSKKTDDQGKKSEQQIKQNNGEIETVSVPEIELPDENTGDAQKSAPGLTAPTAQVEDLPQIDAPTLDLGEAPSVPAQPALETEPMPLEQANAPAANDASGKVVEVDQFQKNDFQQPASQQNNAERKEVEVLKPEDFQAITIENLNSKGEKNDQFPTVPELGYNKKDRESESEKSGLTPEEREKQVQQLLDNLLPPEKDTKDKKDLIITKKKVKIEEEKKEGKVEEEVYDDGIAKDYENLGKPGRIGYKPITYSEDQLTEQFVKAAIVGDKQAVVDLLHSGRPANSRNKFGETPLMAAIYNGHNDITELLLVEGADTNVQDVRGNTPLHVSAARRNYFAAQQLIRNGAIIDARNRANDTPLLIATLNGSIDIVDLLVREGADVNKANDDGLTPLHIAAYNGNAELVKYLLYVGANANMVTREGYKPYDLAYGRDIQVAQVLATYTNAQKYVSKELPKLIQERNKKPSAPQSRSSVEDPYIMFPKAYEEEPQMNPEQMSYEQDQYNWWAATKRGENSVQNVETMKMKTNSIEPNIINTDPTQQLTQQKYASDMTGLVKQDMKVKTQTSVVADNEAADNQSNEAAEETIEISSSAVRKFDELKQNINKDPKLEGKGVEFTEGKKPIELDERLRRKGDIAFKKQTKDNYGANIRASDLGGMIKSRPEQKTTFVSQDSPEAKGQPLLSSVSFSVGSKYSGMSRAQKQQWDIRLHRWVKAGYREYNMSETERQLWLKQKQILEAVYQKEFNGKVEQLKGIYAKTENISYKDKKKNVSYQQVSLYTKPEDNRQTENFYRETPISLQRKLANKKYRSRFDSSFAAN